MSKRILVVDDESVVLGAVARALGPRDYIVDTAQSADQALSLLSRASYDVVIADLVMPDIDGLVLIERIRRMGSSARTIVMTAYPSLESAIRSKRLGVFEYVTKPFTRQELLSVVLRALRHHLAEPTTPGASVASPSLEAVYFMPEHAWVKLEPDRTARVGMARAFADAVGEIVDLELPSEDERLEQGRTCVVVRAEDGVEHDLHSPLSGYVLEVNRRVAENPELALRDPEGEGWLLRLEPRNPEKEIENLVRA